jgi:hypothetical protein
MFWIGGNVILELAFVIANGGDDEQHGPKNVRGRVQQ